MFLLQPDYNQNWIFPEVKSGSMGYYMPYNY